MPGEVSHKISYQGKTLDSVEIRSICDIIQNNGIRLLCLRECEITDQGFKRLMKSVSRSKSILQLTLNVGIITNKHRTEVLAQALVRNQSIRSLFVHGNPIKDEGLKCIGRAIVKHPHICSVDVGDCMLTDDSIDTVCDLIMSHGTKPGLTELCLSANPGITTIGWAKLSMAIAKSKWLRSLLVDYNRFGDTSAGYLLIALSTNNSIEELDLEGTNISNFTVELILHWIQGQQVKIKRIMLDNNKVDPGLIQSVYTALNIVDESVAASEESDAEVYNDEFQDDLGEATVNTTVVKATIHPKQQVTSWTNDENLLANETTVEIHSKQQVPCWTNDENLVANETSVETFVKDTGTFVKETESDFVLPEKSDSEDFLGTTKESRDKETHEKGKKMEEDSLLDEGIGTFPPAEEEEEEVVEPIQPFYQEEEREETIYTHGDKITEEEKPKDEDDWQGDEIEEIKANV